ncbi:MAG: ClbS/DfsB family four-helix bundle protein [Anaerolineae bacterium]|nr:ClbS/DfsB family four-helix bundle protein [Anaerolineae bacterium]
MEDNIRDKTSMMDAMHRRWDALNALLDSLTDEEMTGPTDSHGWTVCDHLTHIAAWERSASQMLRGKPRYDGLGIPASLWRAGDEDDINDAIQKANAGLTPAAARAMLNQAHAELLALLEPLSDEELSRPQSAFLPAEAGGGGAQPAYAYIVGNSLGHYHEHLPWIRKIAGRDG